MSHVLRCLSKLLSMLVEIILHEIFDARKNLFYEVGPERNCCSLAFRNGAKGSLKCKISLMHGSRFVILLIGTVLYQNMGTTDDYLYLLTT